MLILAIVCGAEVTWVDTCMNKKMKLQVEYQYLVKTTY
jgi:hypothetical protein